MKHSFLRNVFLAPALAALIIFSSSAHARAQIPDLRGTWTEHGSIDTLRKDTESDENAALSPITYEIDKQHGRHFEGKIINGKKSEKLIGIISPDNKTFYAVDDHRTITGRIISSSELEIDNLEPGPRAAPIGVSKLERP